MTTDQDRLSGHFDRGLALCLAAYCALGMTGLGALHAGLFSMPERPTLLVLLVGLPLLGLTTVLIMQGVIRPRPFEWAAIGATAVLFVVISTIAGFTLIAIHID